MDEDRLRAFLADFALATRRRTVEILPRVNTCIATTRIGLEVLARFDVVATPRAVTVCAFNQPGWQLANAGVPVDQWDPAGYSVGVNGTGQVRRGEQAGEGRWDGHLVLVVRMPDRRRLLVDLTADQLDRSHRGLCVPGPVLLTLPAWWTPQDPATAHLQGGTVVAYRPIPGPPTWTETPDWQWPDEDLGAAVAPLLEQLAKHRVDLS